MVVTGELIFTSVDLVATLAINRGYELFRVLVEKRRLGETLESITFRRLIR
jgi:hypothetical protein